MNKEKLTKELIQNTEFLAQTFETIVELSAWINENTSTEVAINCSCDTVSINNLIIL